MPLMPVDPVEQNQVRQAFREWCLPEPGRYDCCRAEHNEGSSASIEGLPDLILLDWMLPGMSGIDYARKLRRDKLTQGVQ